MSITTTVEEEEEETIRDIMYTYSFSYKSKQNENTFNHIQTIGDREKKTKARRKERQRNFGKYNDWLIDRTMKSNDDKRRNFFSFKK